MSSKIPSRFGFYAILTDPVKGYEYMTKLMVDMEIPFVQLRIKNSPPGEIERVALKMRSITDGSKTRLIINDYPHIALHCSADGVHTGQKDIDYDKVREIVGDKSIIGISTHSPSQTLHACTLGPDYIGVGPVFPTPTKKVPDPVIGIGGMKEMLSKSSVPSVCIGGINLGNLRDVLEAGAENFCMVRELTCAEKPEKVVKKILAVYSEYYPDSHCVSAQSDATTRGSGLC